MSPGPEKQESIDQFDRLVQDGALAVENLEQPDSNNDGLASRVWMSYWASPQTFKAWWESPAVASFWQSLDGNNAGFWRETFSLPATRAMYEATAPRAEGFGYCGELTPLTSPPAPGTGAPTGRG